MNTMENGCELSQEACEAVQGGNPIIRWTVSTIAGGAFYDGVKSGASAASTAWNSMGAYIMSSHFKKR